MVKPHLSTEHVGIDRWLSDCSLCGTLGVWRSRAWAIQVRRQHICGHDVAETSPELPRVMPIFVVGPRPRGM